MYFYKLKYKLYCTIFPTVHLQVERLMRYGIVMHWEQFLLMNGKSKLQSKKQTGTFYLK